jgi:hypothetical protein
MFGSLDEALERARELLGVAPVQRPEDAEPEVARDRFRALKPRAKSA